MPKAISVKLDERSYIDCIEQERSMPAEQACVELMQAGYIEIVRHLHWQYINGEITFRQMAKKMGLEYRQLYTLLEELQLPTA
jgi:hypothetical protein